MDGEMFFLLFNLFRFEFVPHTFLASGQACLRKLDSSVDTFLSNVKNSYNKRNKNSWKKKSMCFSYRSILSFNPSYPLIQIYLCICLFRYGNLFLRFLTLHARFYRKCNNVLKVNTIIVIQCTIYNVKMKAWIEKMI